MSEPGAIQKSQIPACLTSHLSRVPGAVGRGIAVWNSSVLITEDGSVELPCFLVSEHRLEGPPSIPGAAENQIKAKLLRCACTRSPGLCRVGWVFLSWRQAELDELKFFCAADVPECQR